MGKNSITKLVIDKLKGQASVGRIASTSQQNVSYWLSKGEIPAEAVLALEVELLRAKSSITRFDIRPDVYGPKPPVSILIDLLRSQGLSPDELSGLSSDAHDMCA